MTTPVGDLELDALVGADILLGALGKLFSLSLPKARFLDGLKINLMIRF